MKKIKAFAIIAIVLFAVFAIPNYIKAADEATIKMEQLYEMGDNFVNTGSNGEIDLVDDETTNIVVFIGNMLMTVGAIVIIVSLLVLGIKYMLATPEQAAKLKKQLVGLLIAAVVIFMSYTIWSLVVKFFGMDDIGGGSTSSSENPSSGSDSDEPNNNGQNNGNTNSPEGEEEEDDDIEYVENNGTDDDDESSSSSNSGSNSNSNNNSPVQSEPSQTNNRSVANIYFTVTSKRIAIGEEYTLKLSVSPEGASYGAITWESSDESIATVQKGRIKGISEGTVTIKATTTAGKVATCKITVYKPDSNVQVTSVRTEKTAYSIRVGEQFQIPVIVEPENASLTTLTWEPATAEYGKIASVNQAGIVTGKVPGTAYVVVRTANGQMNKCRIDVFSADATIPVKSLVFGSKTYQVVKGQTIDLDLTVSPANATPKLIWESTNKSVATVDPNTGLVTGVKVGTTTIKVRSSFKNVRSGNDIKKTSCTIKVVAEGTEIKVYPSKIAINTKKENMYIGDTLSLVATLEPSNVTEKTVKWTSGKESVATVDENGKVTAVGVGSAGITGSIFNGKKNISVSCTVTVRKKAEDLDISSIYTYDSNSLKINQGTFTYEGTECYINRVWMQSPGNQIKKVSGTRKEQQVQKSSSNKEMWFPKNSSADTLLAKTTSDPFIAINCETASMDFLSIQSGQKMIERMAYSDKTPTHNGISVNSSCVTAFMDSWREDIFKLNPSFTFSASNVPSEAILVKDGRPYPGTSDKKSARTVVGMVNNNTYIVLTATQTQGLSITQLKDLCVKLNCMWAINLDGGSDTKLYSKTNTSDSLQKLYGGSSNLYSMLYITEYNSNDKAPAYSGGKLDAEFAPYESKYINFSGNNPLSSKISPALGKQLDSLAKSLGASSSNRLEVTSGFRSTELQRARWITVYKTGKYTINWKGGLTEKSSGNSIKACPGKSPHHSGFAVDIAYTGIAGKMRAMSRSTMSSKYHIHQPMDYEPWHYELEKKYR